MQLNDVDYEMIDSHVWAAISELYAALAVNAITLNEVMPDPGSILGTAGGALMMIGAAQAATLPERREDILDLLEDGEYLHDIDLYEEWVVQCACGQVGAMHLKEIVTGAPLCCGECENETGTIVGRGWEGRGEDEL